MNMPSSHSPHRRALAGAMVALLLWAAPSASAITDEEVVGFVHGYLSAAQQPTPDAEVSHYASRVRYFNSGTVDQDFVAQDQRRYYKQWPQRSFELLDPPEIFDADGDAATVRFTIRYDVRGEGGRAAGMTQNTMRVRRFGHGLKIVEMSEQKVRPTVLSRQAEKSRPKIPAANPRPPQPPPMQKAADLPARETAKRDVPPAPRKDEVEDLAPPDATTKPIPLDPTPESATPVPGMPGFVYPPGTEQTSRTMIDVRGFRAGQKVKDPSTGKIFTVPWP